MNEESARATAKRHFIDGPFHSSDYHDDKLKIMDFTANPWPDLCSAEEPYVLGMDNKFVKEHNHEAGTETKIMVRSIPEPFIGNHRLAKLVLLNLNPGHSDADENDHKDPAIRAMICANLRHELEEFSFYPLSPLFETKGAGKWWRPLTNRLRRETGLEPSEFARRLMVIEWFPYHSIKSPGRPKGSGNYLCKSQKYSFELAKHMVLKQGVQAIGMRSKEHWVNADPVFKEVPFLTNSQRPWLTRGNMEPGLFDRVVNAMKANA